MRLMSIDLFSQYRALNVDASTTLADQTAINAVRYSINDRGKLEQLAMPASVNSVSVTDTPRNAATILKLKAKGRALAFKTSTRVEESASIAL